jgi:glycosyltransferase involved in cell wall biosynthesis
VPDTADLYAASDLFALPSYLEGFGLVYVEAAFHGVPSIGADMGGTREAILDGETGLLVPPGDRAALAGAIQRLRDDAVLRRRFGAAARARARARFAPARMADEYAAVFWPEGSGSRAAAQVAQGTGA